MKTFEMKTVIHFGDNSLERLKVIAYKRVLIIQILLLQMGI